MESTAACSMTDAVRATVRNETRVLRDAPSNFLVLRKRSGARDFFAIALLRELSRLGPGERGAGVAPTGGATLDDPATRVAGRLVPAEGRFGVAVRLVKW